ncbi:MAG: SPOR domain-containing protein, partial [Rhodospirillales bacterium]|nr:SPOR domain-containing protein [Rhodospirillales bacterium]
VPAQPAAPAGRAQVQLAALPTRASAEAEWATLRRKFPALLGGRHLILARAEVGGHEWWRVRTAGFADAAAAKQFCARIRAGRQACDVTPF